MVEQFTIGTQLHYNEHKRVRFKGVMDFNFFKILLKKIPQLKSVLRLTYVGMTADHFHDLDLS